MSALPDIPRSFAPVADAGGVSLTIRGRRGHTRREVLWGALKGAGMGLGAALFSGITPDDDGETGMVLRLIRGDTAPEVLSVTGIVLVGAAIVGAWWGWPARNATVDEDVVVRLTTLGLELGGELTPWHGIESANPSDGVLVLRTRGGGPIELRVGNHRRSHQEALLERLRVHIHAAAVSEEERDALHQAARSLTDR